MAPILVFAWIDSARIPFLEYIPGLLYNDIGHVGQGGHGSNDINKFYRNFVWLKLKVTLQDMQYFCSKQIQIRQLTNVTV